MSMGVYIKGMEMPKAEFGSMIVAIRPDGMVEDVMGCYVGKAVPVPTPHGDLIDRDALMDSDGDLWDGMWGWSGVQISNAPTIIPAEEET